VIVSRAARVDFTRRTPSVDPARSAIMRAVRQERTGGELAVRRALRSIGVSAHYNVKSLPGSPDLVTHDGHIAIFVHGCFWHRHLGCPRTTTPKHNRRFWLAKFRANVSRDRRKARALRARGVSVLVIWECETRHPNNVVAKLARAMGRPRIRPTAALR